MKKMNNKGFAVSTMLYGLLIVIVLVMGMIISIMAFNRKNSKEFTQTVVDELEKNITTPVTVQTPYSTKRHYESIGDAVADAPEGSKIIIQSDITENNTINTKEIECTNCTMSINNNILEIYNKEKIVKRLERIYVDFKGIKISNNNIEISEGMTYETLKNNVVLNGVKIGIYDEGKEITSGEIKEGYTLKVISEKYGEIKEYIFTKEYIDITELEIEEEKYITKFNVGQTNKEIKEKIKTTGSVKIEDKDGKIVSESDIIKTGTKVVIEIGKEKQEYTIVVKGDVTGTGQIAMPDVMKAVNYMLNDNNNEDEECYKKAADVTSDGKILMNDVMKIVNYMFEGE